MSDFTTLPEGLIAPEDDGAADHLPGRTMPALSLPSTTGGTVPLNERHAARTVLYVYPMTGRPGVELSSGWDDIPGARGCTPESCGFRDHHADLEQMGAGRVYGLSSQTTAYQAEMVARLRLPFPVLSDPELALAQALELPTFTAAGMTLYRRLTLIVRAAAIEYAFYPVFPPDRHAAEVLSWLREHPRPAQAG